MDNNKYLSELEKRLRKLPPEDRADAISYYSEYLNDIGPGGADQAIATLGSPAQVAAGIVADYTMRDMDEGTPKVKKGISAVWFAVVGVFALPVGLPIAIALFAIAFSVVIVIFSVIISLYATALGIFGGGLAAAIAGFIIIPQSFPTSLFYIGGGFIMIGISILLFIGVTALMRVALKGIAKMFNAIRFRKINKQTRINKQALQAYQTQAGPVEGGEANE